jgi:hypothetical protein
MSRSTNKTTKVRSVALMTAQTTTGAGDGFQLPRLKTIQIDGITTGTVTIQGSNDGSNWYTLSTDTSDNLRELNTPVVFVRGNVTVATSVSVTITAGYESEI